MVATSNIEVNYGGAAGVMAEFDLPGRTTKLGHCNQRTLREVTRQVVVFECDASGTFP